MTVVWDAFICHASEDKDAVARPLADALVGLGLDIWYDEMSLSVGDRLGEAIDHGLANSTYGIVVLSPNFFAKHWPRRELEGLVAREMRDGEKVVLPVWHAIDANEIARHSPPLANTVAARMEDGLSRVVEALLAVMRGADREPAVIGTTDLHSNVGSGSVKLESTVERRDDAVIWRALATDLDISTAPSMKEQIVGLIDGDPRPRVLILDWSLVQWVDTTTLGVLVGATKRMRAREGWVGLVTRQPDVIGTLHETGLHRVVPVSRTVEIALAEASRA